MVVIRCAQSVLLCLILLFSSFAQANPEIDAFLETATALTYDCPDPVHEAQLDKYLEVPTLSEKQGQQLRVLKSSFLNCNGRYDQAQSLLFSVIDTQGIDKSSYHYASAIYQIGFNYDVKEDFDNRCQFYEQAKELAQDKFPDIFLSASLGIISACDPESMEDAGVKLGKLFTILERYSETNNLQALAHIHNTIGLLYGQMDQHVLAADQYLKAHELGLKVYTSSNQLSILISAISSLLGSGQYEKADEAIQEFDRINQDVSTPLTNYWYQFALAGYLYRTQDIDGLKAALPGLASATNAVPNSFYESILAWYSVVPCVHEKDIACIKTYLASLDTGEDKRDKYFAKNPDYLRLKIEMYLILDELENAQQAINYYAKIMTKTRHSLQSAASTLSVANLHSKIYSLEAEIEAEELRKRNTFIGLTALFSGILLLSGLVVRKKFLQRISIDPSTGLLNSAEVFKRISQVPEPNNRKTNALAIFDLDNFRELNRKLGATEGDHILRLIADTICRATRGSDIVGRFAPEQFIVCLHDIEEVNAQEFFKQLKTELEGAFASSHPDLKVGLHTNITVYISGDSFSDLKTVLDEMLFALSIEGKTG